MDVEFPYADDQARQRLLYRLPSVPAARRLLLVCADADPLRWTSDWPGPVTHVGPTGLARIASIHPGSFDAVALPGALDAAGPDAAAMVQDAKACLADGGALVGHVDHAWAVRHLARSGAWRALRRLLSSAPPAGTPRRCRKLLAASGFVEVNCFYVQPSLAAPMGLVPCQWRTARAHFLRAVWSAQGHHGRMAFAARWLSAFVGLGGLQQGELFYWARKPC